MQSGVDFTDGIQQEKVLESETGQFFGDSSYKKILDTLSTAVLVARPIYGEESDGTIADFSVEYTNAAFESLTQSYIHTGDLLSSFQKLLSHSFDWQAVADECVKSSSGVERSYYSNLLKCWVRIVFTGIEKEFITVTVSNISRDKENEIQLRNQNLRLATLTDELSKSQTELKTKFSNMQSLNEQLQYTAFHDSLTKLHNRAAFNESLQKAAKSQEKLDDKFGIFLLNLDNIKNVNDSLGHIAGDEVIRSATDILRHLETETDTAFRFGGDEFILLCTHMNSREEMQEKADLLLSRFRENGISISAGAALYPDDSSSSADMFKFADMAKAYVKKNGKNNVAFFQQVMQEKFIQKMNIESKLSKAMADNLFQLYFQPQFDIATGTLRGFEALIRWHDDDLGWISPDKFIPLAEESRLVIPLGDWVLETAIGTIRKWEKEYNFEGIVSVNVSPIQFKKENFIDELIKKINRHGIDVHHLEIEITEGILIDSIDETVAKLRELRDMGIGISLDDFGTGYSSLRYLQVLPLTTLKIDRSFISNIAQKDGVEADITESIVNLVSKMGLDTIAEGVETDDQLNILKKFNCHNVQGFLKGKPMPADMCSRMLSGDKSAILTIQNPTPESL